MTRRADKEAWNRHFEQLSSGQGTVNQDGIYVLKVPLPPPTPETLPVTIIDPVQSQVNQAEQELKEEQDQYRERTQGVKYPIPPDTRKPPSKRLRSVAIAPPTDSLQYTPTDSLQYI